MKVINYKNMPRCLFITFIVLLLSNGLASSQIEKRRLTKTGVVSFTHTELQSGNNTDLLIDKPVLNSCISNALIQSAVLKLNFRVEDVNGLYNYGDNPFSRNINVSVDAHESFAGTTQSYQVDQLIINENSPEQVFVIDFKDYLNLHEMDKFIIGVSGYDPGNNTTYINNNILLEAEYIIQYSVAYTSNPILTPVKIASATANPLTFSWNITGNGCGLDDMLEYEIQVLKLFNTSEAYQNDPNTIETLVDWNKALSYFTNDPTTSVNLSIGEGEGYYIWRVRPVGDFHSGGAGNELNCGDWSSAPAQYDPENPVKQIFNQSDNAAYFFYFDNQENDKNIAFSRAFGDHGRIVEGVAYANKLLQPKQEQVISRAKDKILVSQHEQDYSGRTVVNTLPAPVNNKTKLGYESNLLQQGSNQRYNVSDFDDDGTLKDPNAVTGGALNYYWSNSNTAEPFMPDAEGYPYTRTIYTPDGTGRIREIGGLGNVHRIGGQADGKTRTTRVFYSKPRLSELMRLFGDECPDANDVYKTTTIDPNGVTTLSYFHKDGTPLASAIESSGTHPTLDKLLSDDPVTSQISGDDFLINDVPQIPAGTFKAREYKRLVFPKDVPNVVVDYTLTASDVTDDCDIENYCKVCDYEVEVYVKNLETGDYHYGPEPVTVLLGECSVPGANTDAASFSVDLAGGVEYEVGRIITYNNPVSGSELLPIDLHAKNWSDQLAVGVNSSLAPILSRLDNNELDLLYNDLGVLPGETEKTITIGSCCSVTIPVNECRTICDDPAFDENNPGFEQMLYDKWGPVLGLQSGSLNAPNLYFFDKGVPVYPTHLRAEIIIPDGSSTIVEKLEIDADNYLINDPIPLLTPPLVLDEGAWINNAFKVLRFVNTRTSEHHIRVTYDANYSGSGSRLFLNVEPGSLLREGSTITYQTNQGTQQVTVYANASYPNNAPAPFPRGKGAFDKLITNMLQDKFPDNSPRYTCDELYGCWQAVVESYGDMVAIWDTDEEGNKTKRNLSLTNRNLNVNILEVFLNCVGRSYQNRTTWPYDNGNNRGYLDNAHRYFYASTEDFDECKTRVCNLPDGTQDPSCGFWPRDLKGDDLNNKKWEQVARCVDSRSNTLEDLVGLDRLMEECNVTAEYEPDEQEQCALAIKSYVESECVRLCEVRRGDLVDQFIKAYKDAGYNVQDDPNASGSYTIYYSDLDCKAGMLINDCRESCTLSIVKDASCEVIALGTDQERQKMTDALVMRTVVEVNNGSSCPGGTIPLNVDNDYTGEVTAALRGRLEAFLEPLAEGEGTCWDYQAELDALLGISGNSVDPLSVKSVSTCTNGVYVIKGIEYEFIPQTTTSYKTEKHQLLLNSLNAAVALGKGTVELPKGLWFRHPQTGKAYETGDLNKARVIINYNNPSLTYSIEYEVFHELNCAHTVTASDCNNVVFEITPANELRLRLNGNLVTPPCSFLQLAPPSQCKIDFMQKTDDCTPLYSRMLQLINEELASQTTTNKTISFTRVNGGNTVLPFGLGFYNADDAYNSTCYQINETYLENIAITIAIQEGPVTQTTFDQLISADFTAAYVNFNMSITIPRGAYYRFELRDNQIWFVGVDNNTGTSAEFGVFGMCCSECDKTSFPGTGIGYVSDDWPSHECTEFLSAPSQTEISVTNGQQVCFGNLTSPQTQTVRIYTGGSFYNYGTITGDVWLYGGTLYNFGEITGNILDANTTYYRNIRNYGTISGTINNTYGNLNLTNESGTIDIPEFTNLTKAIVNRGDFRVNNLVINAGGWFYNQGNLNIQQHIDAGGKLDNHGTLTAGTATFDGEQVTNYRIMIINGNLNAGPSGSFTASQNSFTNVFGNFTFDYYLHIGKNALLQVAGDFTSGYYGGIFKEGEGCSAIKVGRVITLDPATYIPDEIDICDFTPNEGDNFAGHDNIITKCECETGTPEDYEKNPNCPYPQTTFSKFTVTFDCLSNSCGPVCYRKEPIIDPAEEYVSLKPIGCFARESAHLKELILSQAEACLEKEAGQIKANYLATCSRPNEVFKVTYDQQVHHYTLYYHDRAGNLIRTVSPKGVSFNEKGTGSLVTSHQQENDHAFVTEYDYNSLGQLIRQKTPDGGLTDFWYDSKGMLRFSQNDKQRNDGNGTFSFVKYDNLGRVIESGKAEISGGVNLDNQVDVQSYPDLNNSADGNETEIIKIIYSDPAPAAQGLSIVQHNLRNNVSYIYSDEDGDLQTTDDQDYTIFSYDEFGNVEWVVQNVTGLGSMVTEYEYDLISGNVTKVKYNEGRIDQFYHKYLYDADNQPVAIQTSRDGVIWDEDAAYKYYDHGAVKRVELGEDKVQGLDFAYTIHGWLKAINHSNLTITDDPSQDGGTSSLVAKDAFGTILNYYENDFNRSGSQFNSTGVNNPDFLMPDTKPGAGGNTRNLYNGNIASLTANVSSATDAGNMEFQGLTGWTFSYDELNRLTAANFNTFNSGSWQQPGDYNTTYTYDANSNLTSLSRNGYVAQALGMDNLTYNYNSNTNKLDYVTDAVPDNAYAGIDIDGQLSGNYDYDELGNLTKDEAEGILNIEWNVLGKVKKVSKDNNGDGVEDETIDFRYNPGGQRILKRVTKPGLNPVNTFYVYDISGKIMAVYERVDELNIPDNLVVEDDLSASATPYVYKAIQTITSGDNSISGAMIIRSGASVEFYAGDEITITDEFVMEDNAEFLAVTTPVSAGYHFVLKEQPIYGASRIGVNNEELALTINGGMFPFLYNDVCPTCGPGQLTGLFSRNLGHKAYELQDHLGNVRAVVTDRKLADANAQNFMAEVASVSNFYPYGMEMPGRNQKSNTYRFGFNGMEKDDEVNGKGNQYTTEFRQYDPRLGRWTSRDLLSSQFPNMSPYNFVLGNPNLYTDKLGLSPEKEDDEQALNPELKERRRNEDGTVTEIWMTSEGENRDKGLIWSATYTPDSEGETEGKKGNGKSRRRPKPKPKPPTRTQEKSEINVVVVLGEEDDTEMPFYIGAPNNDSDPSDIGGNRGNTDIVPRISTTFEYLGHGSGIVSEATSAWAGSASKAAQVVKVGGGMVTGVAVVYDGVVLMTGNTDQKKNAAVSLAKTGATVGITAVYGSGVGIPVGVLLTIGTFAYEQLPAPPSDEELKRMRQEAEGRALRKFFEEGWPNLITPEK